MKHQFVSAVLLVAGGMLLGACSDSSSNAPSTGPATSRSAASPTATPTPLPKGLKTPPASPELTSAEQAAVDQAMAAGRSGGAAVARLEADPVAAVADRAGTKRVLSTYYLASYYGGILDTIDSFADRGLHLVGSTTQRWSVPVKVDLEAATPVIVLETCTTSEGVRIEGQTGDKKIKVFKTSISRTTFKATGGGALLKNWKAEKADYVGKC